MSGVSERGSLDIRVFSARNKVAFWLKRRRISGEGIESSELLLPLDAILFLEVFAASASRSRSEAYTLVSDI